MKRLSLDLQIKRVTVDIEIKGYYEYLSQKFPALLSGKKGFLNKYKLYLRKRKDSPASATLPCSRRCLILIGFGEYLNYENKL